MSWLNNAVIYQILIDRFAGYDDNKDWRQPDFMGGNLRGIIDTFDYIRDLGVNTIWLSPFYGSEGYHGYWITDFMSVDERFGSEQDLKELIDLAHSHGIRIIGESVPNHISRYHPFFVDARSNKDSQYRSWFTFTKWPDRYLRYMTFDDMPKLNFDNPAVVDHLIQSGRKWLAMGLDGYRIDHVIGLRNKDVKAIFDPLKKEFPNAVFFGEAALFDGSTGDPAKKRIPFSGVHTVRVPNKYRAWLQKEHGLEELMRNYIGMLDGMLDFYTADQMMKFSATKSKQKRHRIVKKLKEHSSSYPPDFSLVHFLDNHDLTRYLFRTNGDINELLQATEILFSLHGAKVIYYGTEVGISQEKSFHESTYHDIEARQPMPWQLDKQNLQLLGIYQGLIKQAVSSNAKKIT